MSFETSYKKFENTVNRYDMIPKTSTKIVIGMSGGKDGGVMGHFLLEYKKRQRKDIEIEMLTAPMPYWEHMPEKADEILETDQRQKEIINEQKTMVKTFHEYWSEYFTNRIIPVEHDLYKDRILNMSWPCMICFCTKTKAFHDFLRDKPYDNGTVLAFGWTKWDAHYTLLSHMLKSNGSKWSDVKKNDPQKYKADCNFLASFLAYPTIELGIPGKKIFRINPMLNFDDIETSALAKELHIPIVKDICKDFHGGNKFNQDRRFFSTYLELFTKNQKMLNLSIDSMLFDYENLLQFLIKTEILPPQEELDGIAYNNYNSDFSKVYEMLRN